MTERSQKEPEKRPDTPKIRVMKNGPYQITGGIPVSTQRIVLDDEGYSYRWNEEEHYPVPDEYILCRCGRSKTKPFCDGIHEKTGFIGTEVASREPYLKQARDYNGPDLNLTDAEIFCATARFCDRAGGIWKLTRESANGEAKRIAIEEAGNCPSGRLVVWDKKTGDAIEPTFERSIGLMEYPEKEASGPIWVRGGIPVESAEGIPYETRNRMTLCRCGHSFNKPFCDSSHLRWTATKYKLADANPTGPFSARPRDTKK